MKRVAIVGCPGAGKTTFARKLSEKTKLPVVHLDFYYHQQKYDYHNNRDAWIKRVKKLIQQDSWIMDGNYSSSFVPRFKRADTIIFFDFPRRTSMHGVVKRRIQYHNKLRVEMPSEWKEKANLEFLKYVWNFNKSDRGKILTAIKEAGDKNVIVFKNRKQANDFLKELRTEPASGFTE